MPFQILPSARPDPFAFANTQGFMAIIESLGKAEALRQERQQLAQMTQLLQQGVPVSNASQMLSPATIDPGARGILQKIGGLFSGPYENPIDTQVQKALISDAVNPQINEFNKKPWYTEYQNQEERKKAADIASGIKPKKQIPKDVKDSLHNAVVAIEKGAELMPVYRRLVAAYPEYVDEIKKALLSQEPYETYEE